MSLDSLACTAASRLAEETTRYRLMLANEMDERLGALAQAHDFLARPGARTECGEGPAGGLRVVFEFAKELMFEPQSMEIPREEFEDMLRAQLEEQGVKTRPKRKAYTRQDKDLGFLV
jgi:hypothetical protein